MTDKFEACAQIVRQYDPDRYFSALFAPAEKRPLLFALYAFNHELARVAETVREPMMGEIRLQWWRDALEGARKGTPRRHDVVEALAELVQRIDLPQALFDTMIDARAFDSSTDTFADYPALETYADETSGNVMRLAARILGAGEGCDALAQDAGIAYGLTGLLRTLPFHTVRHKLYLPTNLLSILSISEDDVFARHDGQKLKAAINQTAIHARDRFWKARGMARPRVALPAFLHATLVPLYLKRMTRRWFDPFHHSPEVP
ncbi:MAG TPA: phytoene/squalene synthase family protein, partial [Rhizomicrobium sp.]|nr:phytoene/squalene synthase family protein [Rhizomicrobium sp.]